MDAINRRGSDVNGCGLPREHEAEEERGKANGGRTKTVKRLEDGHLTSLLDDVHEVMSSWPTKEESWYPQTVETLGEQ